MAATEFQGPGGLEDEYIKALGGDGGSQGDNKAQSTAAHSEVDLDKDELLDDLVDDDGLGDFDWSYH